MPIMKWLVTMFSAESKEEPIPSNFESVQSDVKQVLQLELSSEESREEHGAFVSNTLRALDTEIEDIRRQANGYPENPISALVWMNGAGYGNLASALTHHFRDAGWLEREEHASSMWAKATLAVCSHYHHMVGPAMLANADCHERLGNTERAKHMYGAVIDDFMIIAQGWADETGPPNDEDRLALESLQTAALRLLSRGVHDLDGVDVQAIQRQVDSILSRPPMELHGEGR